MEWLQILKSNSFYYITFIFIAYKDKNVMVKWKLDPGQKLLNYTANTTLGLSKHLHT